MASHVRMQHPDHGFHNAYNIAERKRMTEEGWSVITDPQFKALIAAKTAAKEEVEPEPEAEAVEAPVKKKPGRPKAA